VGTETKVFLPDLGDFHEVSVIEVLVSPGASVAAEGSLITLESDKATMEIPSPYAGIVKSVAVKVGDRISQGHLIAVLDVEEGNATAPAQAPSVPAPPEPAAEEVEQVQAPAPHRHPEPPASRARRNRCPGRGSHGRPTRRRGMRTRAPPSGASRASWVSRSTSCAALARRGGC
jgi:pyruvate dehydrogenase E2 component (dihydrolipoamide acetyltransferase)